VGKLLVSGRSLSTIGTASPAPVLPDKLPPLPENSGWFALFGMPVIWFFLNKGYDSYQESRKPEIKRETNEVEAVASLMTGFIESKDKLLQQVQDQHKSLLDDVINRHDDVLKNMEASLAMQAQVSSTMAENLKLYAEMAIKRSEETARLLAAIEASVNRTLIESFNSHIRINQEVARSLEALKNQNTEESKMLKQLHFRFDKQFGASLDSYDLRQQQG
jgi:hypothetical protein